MKKKLPHWHRVEGWPLDNPSARFALADSKAQTARFYANKNKAQDAADALNRRFNKAEDKPMAFEPVEHMPAGWTLDGHNLNPTD